MVDGVGGTGSEAVPEGSEVGGGMGGDALGGEAWRARCLGRCL